MKKIIKNILKKLFYPIYFRYRIIIDSLQANNKVLDEISKKQEVLNTNLNELTVMFNKYSYIFNLSNYEGINFSNRENIIKDMIKKDIFVPFVPIEHFYSPFPTINDINTYDYSFFPSEIQGIDLNTEKQLNLLKAFEQFYSELPFEDEKTSNMRFYYINGSYSYSDAIWLYCMIRYLTPQKIIEVGSGFSSCVTLDTNELFLNNKMQCTFIEPYPNLLKSLIKDNENIKLYESNLQNIPISIFTELNENDILFIDSTHVSKFNSDVNYIFHEILPILKKGVYIHFHDIFYPFEYPKGWLLEGRAWNEQYILRAFLEFNKDFEIALFNTYLQKAYKEELKKSFPLVFKNTGGSIWIKRI